MQNQCTRPVERASFSTTTMDQFDYSQPWRACFLTSTMWILLFLNEICGIDGFDLDIGDACHGGISRLSDLQVGNHERHNSNIDYHCFGWNIWVASAIVYRETALGVHHVDVGVDICHSSVLVLYPLYAYWHFDDFSWGNTRIVVGEKGKKIAVGEEEEFDPKSIPTMTWSKYEKMLLAEDYWSDGMSQGSSSNSRSSSTHHSRIRAPTTLLSNNISGDNLSMAYPAPSTTGFYTTDGGSMMIPSSASIPMIPVGYTTTMQPAPPSVSTFNIQQQPSHGSMNSFSRIQDHLWQQQQQQQRPQFMHMHSSATVIPGAGIDDSSLGDMQGGTEGPTNEEVLSQVKRILATSDLTRVTKKQVREELQQVFGVSMASRKDYINDCIEGVLQGRL